MKDGDLNKARCFFVAAGVMFDIDAFRCWPCPEGGATLRRSRRATRSKRPSTADQPAGFCCLLDRNGLDQFRPEFRRDHSIQAQYLFPGYAALPSSSRTLSTIVNTESIAMILSGLAVGGIVLRIGNGPSVLLGTLMGVAYLLIFATASHLSLIYVGSFLKGCAESIIVASSYAFASVLIPRRTARAAFWIVQCDLLSQLGTGRHPGCRAAGRCPHLFRTVGRIGLPLFVLGCHLRDAERFFSPGRTPVPRHATQNAAR
jgi:hypothetical protein